MGDEERETSRFRDVRITGVDADASQHVRDDLWDIHIRLTGSSTLAWRGLFDEEFENGPDTCRLRHADRHIVIECVPTSRTESYLERVKQIAARANDRYRTEVVPHVEELDSDGRSGGTAEQRRLLRELDPLNGPG